MQRRTVLFVAIACLVIVAGIVIIAAYVVAGRSQRLAATTPGAHGMPGGPMMEGAAPGATKAAYDSAGERIYHTATDAEGKRISFTGGPHWLSMHGGSCVSCHGPDGRGGIPVMPTGVVAPDIRYDALTGKEHPEVETEEGEHEHEAYTDAGIKRAITDGIEPSGEELDPTMPRWRMSEKQLDSLLDYLKEIGRPE